MIKILNKIQLSLKAEVIIQLRIFRSQYKGQQGKDSYSIVWDQQVGGSFIQRKITTVLLCKREVVDAQDSLELLEFPLYI